MSPVVMWSHRSCDPDAELGAHLVHGEMVVTTEGPTGRPEVCEICGQTIPAGQSAIRAELQ